MLSDTRCPRTGPRERASYRADLCLDISVRSVFTVCYLSHPWDCQRFHACVKYQSHLPLSSLVVNEDLPWKPSDQGTLIQGPKWGAWSTDFKSSLSLLTASLLCAWEHLVKVGMGDYSLQVNSGSLLFLISLSHRPQAFHSEVRVQSSIWGFLVGWTKANLSEHLVAMLEGGSRFLSPGLCSLNLTIATRSEVWISSSLAMISLMPGLVLKGTLYAMVVCDCLLTISLLCSLQ